MERAIEEGGPSGRASRGADRAARARGRGRRAARRRQRVQRPARPRRPAGPPRPSRVPPRPARDRRGRAGRPRLAGGHAHRRRQEPLLPAAGTGLRAADDRGQPADRADGRSVEAADGGRASGGDDRLGLPDEVARDAHARIRDGRARIVYCSPERFASPGFWEAISSREVDLLAVDEAHCISEWGHDFRPDYLRLPRVIERLGRPTRDGLHRHRDRGRLGRDLAAAGACRRR